MTVSIITPSRNQGRFIGDTIRSVAVQRQTYPHVEHIVVDAASTDETLDVLRSFGDEIRWLSEPDRGFADAVNKGLGMATGDIIGIQSSDDLYEPNAIATVIEAFAQNPDINLIYGGYRYSDASGATTQPHIVVPPFDLQKLLRMEAVVPQNSAFFRKRAIENAGPLDIDCDYVADLEFWLRLSLDSAVVTLPECLSTVRQHPGQRNVRSARFGRDWRRALEKNHIEARVSKHDWLEIDAAAYLFSALYEARSGSPAAALSQLLKAAAASPAYTLVHRASSIKDVLAVYAKRLLKP